MAYSRPTFNDILLSLSYRYGESSVPASGIDNRKYWANRGVEFIMERLKLRKSVAVTVTSGTAALSVTPSTDPAPDFKNFFKLLDSNGNPYTLTNKDEYDASTGTRCCITGSHSDGYTLHVKDDGDYTLYYAFYISPMVNTTDVCIIPDAEAVAAYAYAQIRMSETDPLEDADKNMQECIQRSDAMAEDMARNEGDLTFKVLF